MATPRKRNYKAEYAARKARSEARYGVTYSKQRRLVEKGQKAGLSPAEVRRTLTSFKGKAKPGNIVDRLISRREGLEGWDPFAPCINVDKEGDECGHIPSEHYIKDPHPCTSCSCPEYIPPVEGEGEMPESLFYYK